MKLIILKRQKNKSSCQMVSLENFTKLLKKDSHQFYIIFSTGNVREHNSNIFNESRNSLIPKQSFLLLTWESNGTGMTKTMLEKMNEVGRKTIRF